MFSQKVLFIFSLFSSQLIAQEVHHNFDFESHVDGKADGWSIAGESEYEFQLDHDDAYHGNTSISIQSKVGDNSKAGIYSLAIPVTFVGKKIKLTGYLKTKGVTGGWAGLWLRIDPQLGIDNMQNRGVTGTTDWTKYEVELDLKADQATSVTMGGLLVGQGEMWLDHLEVTIDGKSLSEVPEKQRTKAQLDAEFNLSSNISFSSVSKQMIDNINVLGKVWGFLKYHHPQLSTGNYNWDFELFRVMEEIVSATTGEQRDVLILKWITSYGEIPNCESCLETHQDVYLKPAHDWIESDGLTPKLQQQLMHIYNNRNQGLQYYVDLFPGVGNPNFKNENDYKAMAYPDAGFRLLALYRFWNIVHYYYPYRDITDKAWDIVLKEYIPRFIDAKNELEYEIATLQLIGEVQDSHANLWGGGDKYRLTKGDKIAPVEVRFIESQLVVTGYHIEGKENEIGLELGDVILTINGESVVDIVREKTPYYPASNQAARLRDIAREMLQSNNDQLIISYLHDSIEFTKVLPLESVSQTKLDEWNYAVDTSQPSHKLLADNIAYVTLANIKTDDIPTIANAYENSRGMIIDIRNYPSDFVVYSLGSLFVPEGTEFAKVTIGNINNPGEFRFVEAQEVGARPLADIYQGKVVVLVNEYSQSLSEYTAMAISASSNVTVIGSMTAGADGNLSWVALPGGLRTSISGIGIFYPDGKPTQRIGIIPEINVEPTIRGIKAGRDEVLEKAIEFINSEKN